MSYWPKHADGKPKSIGEMSASERNAVMVDVSHRVIYGKDYITQAVKIFCAEQCFIAEHRLAFPDDDTTAE
jgi:hypothetical protein